MIVPDINMLIYAYNDGSPYYQVSLRWWEELVNGTEMVGMPWIVTVGL